LTDRYVAYDGFADVYNRHWGGFAARVIDPLCRLGLDQLVPGDRVLDVCCGTGQLAAALTERGFEVVGVDGSEAMIALARSNAPDATFVVADARAFSVAAPAKMAVSTFDSLNHVVTLDGLNQVFARVAAALDPGGRFVFDLNMADGFRARWHGAFVIDEPGEFIVAESSYDEDDASGTVKLTMFAGQDDLWRRTELVLTQRCYAEGDVVGALKMSGFAKVQVIDAGDLIPGWQQGRSFFSAVVPVSP
jgi:SAM-dependent methyltransferase